MLIIGTLGFFHGNEFSLKMRPAKSPVLRVRPSPGIICGCASKRLRKPCSKNPSGILVDCLTRAGGSMRRKSFLFFLPFLLAILGTASSNTNPFDGKSWWEHVKVLANDNMEGRETGSEGLRKAEAYIVAQVKKDGLQAAGSKEQGGTSFYQPVKFESRQIVENDSSLALVRDGEEKPLTLGEDAMFSTRVDLATEVEAPLVFVGYGLTVPEKNYDDLAGLNLKDKVVVMVTGSPAEMPPALASHYQSTGERWKTLHKAGVIGVIALPNPAAMDIPWSRMALSRTRPSMGLTDPQLNETAGEKLVVVFNPDKADLLFAGSAHTFQEIADLAKDRKALPRFPLAVSVRAKAAVKKEEVESANVIAKWKGSDPKLAGST